MFKNAGWEETLEEINPNDPNETWKLVRKVKKKVNLPPIHGPNGLKYSDADKVEAFADTMERQFRVSQVYAVNRWNIVVHCESYIDKEMICGYFGVIYDITTFWGDWFRVQHEINFLVGRLLLQRHRARRDAKFHATNISDNTLPNGFTDDISEVDADIDLTTPLPCPMPSVTVHSAPIGSIAEVVRYPHIHAHTLRRPTQVMESDLPRSLSSASNTHYYYG
ncbi:hypothetical protein JTB14_001914 [Gonioctena quinquepunctata]|nr:hypothetical protein JTB14_001914 [Gonioctena quinquepunctata]